MYRIKYSVLFFITLVSINLWSVTSLQLITTPQAKVFINDEEIEDVNSDGKYLKSGFPTNKTIEIKFTIDGYKDLLKHIRFSNSFENKKIVVSESDFEKLHNISNLTKVGIVQVLSIPNNLEFTINGKIQYTNTKFSQLKVGEYIFEFDYDGTKLKSTAKFATNGNYVIQADFTNKKLLVAKEIIFRTNDSWETLKINGNTVSENSNYFKDYYEISEIHEIKATSNGQTITKIIDFQQNYEDIFFSNLIFVKGGTFMMGSSKEKAPSDEKPLHKVKVNDFVMSKFEVTQKEWFSIMKTNPSITKNDMFPVTAVSWVKAVEFCNEKSIAENFDPCYNIDGLKVSCDF
ncbi:MAG: SUMF1/EgtB/PvdO family nonheme iron enzyme, partial [Candidatus Cloacimonadota bacterium]|nr:SUMF1/EgtB/PvdO family nonheme iron enzyme [Candidatus Cloacimonadota bacterium]